jgi:hypothetical protein
MSRVRIPSFALFTLPLYIKYLNFNGLRCIIYGMSQPVSSTSSMSPLTRQNICAGVGVVLVALAALAAFASFIPNAETVLSQYRVIQYCGAPLLLGLGGVLISEKLHGHKTLMKVLLLATLIFALAAPVCFFYPHANPYTLPLAMGLGFFAGGALFGAIAVSSPFSWPRKMRNLIYSLTSTGYVAEKSVTHFQETEALRHRNTIGAGTVVDYGAYLERTYPQQLKMDLSFVAGGKAPFIDENIPRIAIPVILEGAFEDHIVLIMINPQAKTLRVYDSKGVSICDHDEPLLLDPSRNLRHLVYDLERQYQITSTTENTERHQTDSHNCGVFVLDAIERELNPALKDTPQTSDAMNTDVRQRMIQNLVKMPPRQDKPPENSEVNGDNDDF